MIVTAISFPHVCTTVDAEELSTSEYPYQIYIPDYNEIWISKTLIQQKTLKGASNTPLTIVDPDGQRITSTTTYANDAYWCPYSDYKRTGFKLINIDGVGWSAYELSQTSRISYTGFNGYIFELNYNYLNGHAVMVSSTQKTIAGASSVSVGSINVDGGLSEDDINNLINDLLNSTTQTTTTANNLQSGLASDYTSYQNGNITSETLQVSVDNTVSQLNSLNNNSGNTLADLISINNGLTYAQTVQDKINADEIIETQTVSSSVQININGYITQANNAYSQFIAGGITQSEAINTIQQQIINLNNMIGNQATKAADIAAVNAAINTVQNTSTSVHNYSELDKSISDKSQQSDSEELNYINDLQNETTSQLQDFAPSQKMNSQQQTEVKNNLLNLIWDNELIKMILPLAGACMIICVTLGIKYKL